MNPDQYIIALARAFPTLKRHLPEQPNIKFDPDRFFARCGGSSGEDHAVLFVLNVWNPYYAKSKGWSFDLFDALGSWDSEHREVFLQWCQRPRWP